MSKAPATYTTPDGTTWSVDVELTGASAALIVFRHPDPATSSRKNRYAWLNWQGAEANDVRANIDPRAVRAVLTEEKIAELFRRSMPVGNSLSGPVLIQG